MSQEVLPQETGEKDTPITSHRPRRWLRGIGLILVVAAFLAGYFLIIAYLGWQSGQDQLAEMQTAELQTELNKQLTLAQSDLSEGRYALANERMKWVLGRQPDNEEAAALQQQAHLGLAQILTPQPMVTLAPTTTPTVMPTITPTPAPVTDPDSELTRIEELIDDEVWEDVISSLINFQQQFPSHKRPHTDELLYESYIALGLSLMDGEQVELGMYYLSQARRLGDLPIEAVDYETWAELYLQGIAFYGTNWGASAYYFRDLCLAAPFYQNSCDRLLEVLEAYGDQYAFVLDWCPAQELYAEAQQHQRTQAIVTKLAEAREGCLAATPTPIDPITNTVPITNAIPITNVQPFVLPSFSTPTAEP
jgi:hypothetical protein